MNKSKSVLALLTTRISLVVVGISSLCAGTLMAAPPEFWVGNSGATNTPTSGTWTVTTPQVWCDGNVSGGIADAGWTNGNSAIFGGVNSQNITVTIGGAVSAAELNFANSGYTLSASAAETITVSSSPSFVMAPGTTNTIGANVTAALSSSFVVGATGGGNAGALIVGTGTAGQGGTIASSKALLIGGTNTVVNVVTGGTLSTANATASFLSIGSAVGDSSTLEVNGGTVNIQKNSGSIWIPAAAGPAAVANASGTLDIESGSVTETGGFLSLGQASGDVGTLNLDGGTLTTAAVTGAGTGVAGAGTGIANFNGGVLKAQQAAINYSLVGPITAAHVRNGGAVINNNGFAVNISQPLLHTTNTADNAIDGGLTSLGSAALTLTGINTYTGPTLIMGGSLTLTNSGSINDSSALTVSNATLQFPVVSGLPTNIITGTFSTIGSGNTIKISAFTGTGVLPFQFTIIKYTTAGTGLVDNNNDLTNLSLTLPTGNGLQGYLTNNVAKSSIDLVITGGTLTPLIQSQPVSVVRYTNYSAQFIVTATAAVSYQWQTNGVNINNGGNVSGATSGTLTITNINASNAGNFTVVITNSAGSVTSVVATLSIETPDCAYEAAIVSNTPVSYYRFNETGDPINTPDLPAYDYAGGNNGVYGDYTENSYYGINGPQPSTGFPGFDANNGAVEVLYAGSANSEVTVTNWPIATNSLTLMCWINPTGSQVPNAGLILNRGANVAGLTYTADTDGNGNYTLGYTWNNDANTFNWNSGLTPPPGEWSLVALVVTSTNATIYVANTNGVASAVHTYPHPVQSFSGPIAIGTDPAGANGLRNFSGIIDEAAVFNYAYSETQILSLLTIATGLTNFPPSIVDQPVADTVVVGDTAQFTVGASGTSPLSYQWLVESNGNYVNLSDGGQVSGSMSGVLTISDTTLDDTTNFMVIVTNLYGSITSAPAMLTVLTTRPVVTLTAQDGSGSSSFNSAGNWSNHSAPAYLNDYLVDSLLLRSPADANSYTFAGHSLTIQESTAESIFACKGTSASVVYTFGTNVATGLFLNGGFVGLWVGNAETVAGYITLDAGGGGFDPESASPLNIASLIGGPGYLIVGAAGSGGPTGGTVVLENTNTYTGGTVIDAADKLQLSGSGTLGSTAGSLEIINTNANAGYGTLDLNGTSQTIGNLSGTGGTILNSAASTTNSLTIGSGGNGGGNFAGSISAGGGVLSLIKTGAGTIALSGTNTYTGPTLINGGTLALSGAGLMSGTPAITIASGATFDVSGLATPLSLGAGQTLAGTGATGTVNGSLNLGSGGLALNYSSGTPTLSVSGGSLAMNNNNVVVTNTGAALPVGSYKIISKGAGGSVSGSVSGSTVSVVGGGVAAGTRAGLSISGGELYLTVVTGSGPVISSSYNGTVLSLSWSGGGNLLQATNLLGPWTTNTGATSPFRVTTATNGPKMFYRVQQ